MKAGDIVTIIENSHGNYCAYSGMTGVIEHSEYNGYRVKIVKSLHSKIRAGWRIDPFIATEFLLPYKEKFMEIE